MHAVLDIARKAPPHPQLQLRPEPERTSTQAKFRACLEHDLGNCKSPLHVGKQSLEDYDRGVDAIRDILKGQHQRPGPHLRHRPCARRQKRFAFEAAEDFKRRKGALKKFQAKSTVVNPDHP